MCPRSSAAVGAPLTEERELTSSFVLEWLTVEKRPAVSQDVDPPNRGFCREIGIPTGWNTKSGGEVDGDRDAKALGYLNLGRARQVGRGNSLAVDIDAWLVGDIRIGDVLHEARAVSLVDGDLLGVPGHRPGENQRRKE